MVHSTVNQTSHSTLLDENKDSLKTKDGLRCGDMSEKTLKNGMVMVWYFVVMSLALFVTSGYFLFQGDYPQAWFALIGSAVLSIPILTIWHTVHVERVLRKL